jgi:RHS repeat-associated protein
MFKDYVPQTGIGDDDNWERLSGIPTGNVTTVLDNNNTALYAVSFYDKYGRVIQSVSQNHLGGWDRVSNEYDFVGNVTLSKQEHLIPSNDTIETWQRFTYDHGNRLTKTEHRIGNDPLDWIIMSEMQYNEIGEMVQKNIHSQDNGSRYWQSVDYKYNIRGWLTNINSGFLSDDNMIIAHDENLEGLEMVIGLTIDTIHYDLEYIEDKRGPNDKIKVEISDNKTIESELVIPGTINEGEANESEVLYLYAIGDDDGEDYTTMLPLDGYSFLFDLNQLHINSSSTVHDVLLAIDTKIIAELDNQNVDDVDQLEIVRNHVAVYVLNTLGISYLNEDGDDLFGMDLLYNNPPSSLGAASQYNGNISGIKWQSVNDEKAKCYGFNYDKLNRLKEAQYGEWDNSGTWSYHADRYTVENFQYDLNGNILSLKRYGLNMYNGEDMGFGTIDDLTYSYAGNGNQLTAVEDVVSDMSFHSNDFSDGTSTGSGEYTYDVNGNMISDANKGISVTYNHMNLPTEIDFGNNNKIIYLYLANGTKLKKTVEYTSSNNDTKDYVGSFNYTDGAIECILTGEGKLSPDAGASNGFRYEYYHKDHLGNIRMTFSDLNENGSIEDDTEVLQENHYYPFGMEMMGLETPQIGAEDEYKYNGKELQVEHGLNWYDYGARFYDAQLGRWVVIDPLNEFMPSNNPYGYTYNNPYRFIDPNGKVPWPVNKTFGRFKRRVSSWFGPRKVDNNAKATTNHKGLDINLGYGDNDFGAPVISTHDGKVHKVKESTDGNGGRSVTIQAKDGSFQTYYAHLSLISVEEGQNVNEGDKIGEIGASASGKEDGSDTHLHYAIQKKNSKSGKMQWYDPTEGKGNEEKNIVNPQSWVDSSNEELENAMKNIVEAGRVGNMEDVSKWIETFERLQDKQNKDK